MPKRLSAAILVALLLSAVAASSRRYIDTATYSTRSHLERSSAVHFSRGTGRQRAFTIHTVYAYPAHAPAAPVLRHLC